MLTQVLMRPSPDHTFFVFEDNDIRETWHVAVVQTRKNPAVWEFGPG